MQKAFEHKNKMLPIDKNRVLFRLAGRESVRLEEVKDESFISKNTGYGFRNLTDHFFREAGFVQNIAFEGDEPTVNNFS